MELGVNINIPRRKRSSRPARSWSPQSFVTPQTESGLIGIAIRQSPLPYGLLQACQMSLESEWPNSHLIVGEGVGVDKVGEVGGVVEMEAEGVDATPIDMEFQEKELPAAAAPPLGPPSPPPPPPPPVRKQKVKRKIHRPKVVRDYPGAPRKPRAPSKPKAPRKPREPKPPKQPKPPAKRGRKRKRLVEEVGSMDQLHAEMNTVHVESSKPNTRSSKKRRLTVDVNVVVGQATAMEGVVVHQATAMEGVEFDQAAAVEGVVFDQARGMEDVVVDQPNAMVDLARAFVDAVKSTEMVAYQERGALVVAEPVRAKKFKPKVRLGEEDLRVWNLLVKHILEDEETSARWAGERERLEKMVMWFIDVMHLVQGNRQFTLWKGSVVEACIGVFLTQNTSDNLSSGSFMNLVSKFPLPAEPPAAEDPTAAASSSPSESPCPYSVQIDEDDRTERRSSVRRSLFRDLDLNLPPKPEAGWEAGEQVRSAAETSRGSDTTTHRPVLDTRPNEAAETSQGSDTTTHRPVLDTRPNEAAGTSRGSDTTTHRPVLDTRPNEAASFSSIEEAGERVRSAETSHGSDTTTPDTRLKEAASSSSSEASTITSEGIELTTKGKGKGKLDAEWRGNATTQGTEDMAGSTRGEVVEEMEATTSQGKGRANRKTSKAEQHAEWWKKNKDLVNSLRGKQRPECHADSADWEAVLAAGQERIAEVIKERGMNNVLAGRIEAFLRQVKEENGAIDLEWLREMEPKEVKTFLLTVEGLGLKSVECVRLLTLLHEAFPVDVNVGRIAVRLGWVPIEELPDGLHFHNLEAYPVQDTVQKYLWPRLCKLDQRTLYELHYQLITCGKVFCTKIRPNCKACPLQGGCYFNLSKQRETLMIEALPTEEVPKEWQQSLGNEAHSTSNNPIVEEPAEQQGSMEPTVQNSLEDIEDMFKPASSDVVKPASSDVFHLDLTARCDPQASTSQELMVLPRVYPSPSKLREELRLRTVHTVYILPDFHPLVTGILERRQYDDPGRYLFLIYQEPFSTARFGFVSGTFLIPCRTAMRGSFPLNGTYFQVNEVFADHATSMTPLSVPTSLIWDLPKCSVYCGTTVTAIFRDTETDVIKKAFWEGYVCIRGFDRDTRAPQPLSPRLHNTSNRLARPKTKSP